MIISVTGLIGSGKDSIASYLIENYYFEKESFAGSLKDAAAAVFGWDRELVEGATRISREWREKIDPWWAERLGIPHLTPRWVLQNWGTEVFRQHFHNDIWIASLENKLQHKEKHVVLTDSRFPNELKMVREQEGSLLVRVKRGDDPIWFPLAQDANKGNQESKNELQNLGIHASEYSWVGEEFDLVLTNDGTLDDLFVKIDNIMVKYVI
jgi:hypothetical protein